MTITTVSTSNTFNEFRTTFNDTANLVNSFTGGTGAIFANTITTANGITVSTLTSGRVPLVSTAGLIVDDSTLTYNTSTDVLTLGGSTDASSSTTGTLIVTGGVGVAKKLHVGTDLTVTSNTTLSGTTDASSSTTGAVIVTGGVGIAKKLYVGTDLNVGGNTTLTGELRGPSTFTIDPAVVGDDTGTVVIRGNLQIDGITTTINSTTLTVNDKNIVLANNAPNSAAANGAGITIAGASANIVYLSSNDVININKNLELQAANVTTLIASSDSSFTSTGALLISKGTTGQRTAGTAGQLRFNTTTAEFEGYNGGSWASVGGSAISNDTSTASNLFPAFLGATTGTAASIFTSNSQYLFKPSTGELSVKAPRASNGIVINNATISSDYTIAAGDNGMSAGPITIDTGVTVTISSGSVWTVV